MPQGRELDRGAAGADIAIVRMRAERDHAELAIGLLRRQQRREEETQHSYFQHEGEIIAGRGFALGLGLTRCQVSGVRCQVYFAGRVKASLVWGELLGCRSPGLPNFFLILLAPALRLLKRGETC